MQSSNHPSSGRFNNLANSRKYQNYWLGFLEGILSSGDIEKDEPRALLEEATKLSELVYDHDMLDMKLDLSAECFSSDADLIEQILQIIDFIRSASSQNIEFSAKDHENALLGFCAGISCDGRILPKEIHAIQARFENDPNLSDLTAFHELQDVVQRASGSNKISTADIKEIETNISLIVGNGYRATGLPNINSVSKLAEQITNPEDLRIKGATIVITGSLRMGSRQHAHSKIESAGGFPANRITRTTDYLVISNNAARDWKTTHYGTKIEHAKKLITAGRKIRLVDETAFADAMNNLESD